MRGWRRARKARRSLYRRVILAAAPRGAGVGGGAGPPVLAPRPPPQAGALGAALPPLARPAREEKRPVPDALPRGAHGTDGKAAAPRPVCSGGFLG